MSTSLVYSRHSNSGPLAYDIVIDVGKYVKNIKAAELWLANEVLANCNDFVPFLNGRLKGSGHVIDDGDGHIIEWNTPYAHYQYTGIVYINPKHNAAGWQDNMGLWHGFKGPKVPTGKKIVYSTPGTGDHWIDTAREQYQDHWEAGVQKIIGGGRV